MNLRHKVDSQLSQPSQKHSSSILLHCQTFSATYFFTAYTCICALGCGAVLNLDTPKDL